MPREPDESTLDRAYDAWLSGRHDDAARATLSLLTHDPGSVPGLLLACRALLAHALRAPVERRSEGAPLDAVRDGLLRAGQAAIRRGNLPLAAVAAAEIERASEDEAWPQAWRAEAREVAATLRAEIAQTFGRGSTRVAEVPPAPPSLPPPPAVVERHKELAGDALFDRLESSVLEIACDADPFDDGARVPRLPLFGELPAEALARLLASLTVRDVARGETVLREGDTGREAFVVSRGRLSASKLERGKPVVVAELGPGAIFGEMALVTESPRAATVVAQLASTLLVAQRGTLERLARDVPALATELGVFCRDRLVTNLATFAPCLRAIPEAERLELLASCPQRLLERGETLFRVGDPVDGLCLVATGTLEVVAGEGADRTLVGRIGPGDVAGVTSFVLRRPSSLRVRAATPSTVLSLSLDAFRVVAERHPSMLWWLWEVAIVRSDRLAALLAQDATEVGDVPIG